MILPDIFHISVLHIKLQALVTAWVIMRACVVHGLMKMKDQCNTMRYHFSYLSWHKKLKSFLMENIIDLCLIHNPMAISSDGLVIQGARASVMYWINSPGIIRFQIIMSNGLSNCFIFYVVIANHIVSLASVHVPFCNVIYMYICSIMFLCHLLYLKFILGYQNQFYLHVKFIWK